MIEKVLHDHLSRYPDLQIQDLYKLLHQAALGNEHAVSDIEAARRWLYRELAEMGEGIIEPLIDPISHTGDIVRVHLRPYLATGYDPQSLLEVFIRSANEYRGDAQLLELYWQDVAAITKFSTQEMDEFFHTLKANNYPAVHHSPEYKKNYHPVYRVVYLPFCPKTWM